MNNRFIENNSSEAISISGFPLEENLGIAQPIAEFKEMPKIENLEGTTFNKLNRKDFISSPAPLYYQEGERKKPSEKTALEYRLINLQNKRQALKNRIIQNRTLLNHQEEDLKGVEETIGEILKKLEEF